MAFPVDKQKTSGPRDPNAIVKRRMTFKEKREFEQVTNEIELLNTEKKQIEERLSSGNIDTNEITELSRRLPVVNNLLDEKEMRWLELSEIES